MQAHTVSTEMTDGLHGHFFSENEFPVSRLFTLIFQPATHGRQIQRKTIANMIRHHSNVCRPKQRVTFTAVMTQAYIAGAAARARTNNELALFLLRS